MAGGGNTGNVSRVRHLKVVNNFITASSSTLVWATRKIFGEKLPLICEDFDGKLNERIGSEEAFALHIK